MGSAVSFGRRRLKVFPTKTRSEHEENPDAALRRHRDDNTEGRRASSLTATCLQSFATASRLSLRASVDGAEGANTERLWNLVRGTCVTGPESAEVNQPQSAAEHEPVVAHAGWITVKLFVASTMDDFVAERHFLETEVLRELRQWCEGEKIHLIITDLHSSLDREQRSVGFLSVCLEEIDRCQENGMPMLFLGLLSETLGWIPQPDDVPEELAIKYGWIHGLSLLEMICVHAAYRTANTNAVFFLRDPESLKSLSEELREKYLEPEKQAHLDYFKEKLRERFPGRVFQYKTSFVPGNSSTQAPDGRSTPMPETVAPGSMEPFRFRVLNFFKERIKKQFPLVEQQAADMIEEFREAQDRELLRDWTRCQQLPVLPHLRAVERQIQLYINGQGAHAPLVVTGDIGAGKTGVFTRSVHQLLKNGGHQYQLLSQSGVRKSVAGPSQGQAAAYNSVKMHMIRVGNSWAVFHHYVGALPYSRELSILLQRLWHAAELQPPRLGTMPADIGQLACQIGEMISKRGPRRLAIFINHLDEMLEYNNEFLQKWLPGHLPENIRVVVTLRANSDSLKVLMDRHPQPTPVHLGFPSFHDCCQLIRHSLTPAVSSKLTNTQIEDFVDQLPDHTPMALVEAGRLLSVEAGDMQDGLQSVIHKIPGDLLGILDQWLCHFERMLGFREVAACFCLLHISRNGLLESELLAILGALDTRGEDGNQEYAAIRDEQQDSPLPDQPTPPPTDVVEESSPLSQDHHVNIILETPAAHVTNSVSSFILQSGPATPLPGAVESHHASLDSGNLSRGFVDTPLRRRSVPSSASQASGYMQDSGFASLVFGRRGSFPYSQRLRSSRGLQLSEESLSSAPLAATSRLVHSQMALPEQHESPTQGLLVSEQQLARSVELFSSTKSSQSPPIAMSRNRRSEKRYKRLFDEAPLPSPSHLPSLHWAYLVRYLQPWIRKSGKVSESRWVLAHRAFHWVVDMHYFQRPPSREFPFILSISPEFYQASHSHFGSSLPRLCKTYGERRQSQQAGVQAPQASTNKHVSFRELPAAAHLAAEDLNEDDQHQRPHSNMSFQQVDGEVQITQQRYGWWQERLAGFFEESVDEERIAEELPGQLAAINDRTRLARCLTNWTTFEQLLTKEQSGELLRLWRVAGGGKAAIPKYRHSLESLQATDNCSEVTVRRAQVANLMFLMEEFEEAQQLLMEAREGEMNAGASDMWLAELHLSLAKVFNEVSQRTDFKQEAARILSPPDLPSLHSVRTQADTTAALQSHPSLGTLTASSSSSVESVEHGGGWWHDYHSQLQTNVHSAACQISHKVVQEARLAVDYLKHHSASETQPKLRKEPTTLLMTCAGVQGDKSRKRSLLMAEALSLISSHLSLLAQWDKRDSKQVDDWCSLSSQAAADCRNIYRQLGDIGHEVGALLSLVAAHRNTQPQHALQLLEEALALTQQYLGERHHLAGQIHQEIASLVDDRHTAMQHYRRWMDVTAHLYGQQHPLTHSVQQQVCLILNQHGEKREAKKLQRHGSQFSGLQLR